MRVRMTVKGRRMNPASWPHSDWRVVGSARRGGEEKKNKSLVDMHFVGKATSAVLTG